MDTCLYLLFILRFIKKFSSVPVFGCDSSPTISPNVRLYVTIATTVLKL